MNLNECRHEASLLAALASGSVPDELTEHLSSCAVCQDAHLVWNHLHACGEVDLRADLPSPGVIWWRAQVAKKRAVARRSVAAIEVMQRIALLVGALALVAIAAWQEPKLSEIPPILLAGCAATLMLLFASVIVVRSMGRPRPGRTSARGI